MKNIWIVLSLIASCILCLLLGSHMLFHKDFFYLSDQARDFMLVKSIVVDHKLTLIGSHSGLGGLFHGPLWLYMLSPVFFIGKGNPLIFAYFYACIPLSTILVGFFIAKKLYGDFFAVLVAFFLGTHIALWGYISNTIGINIMPLLYILFLYCSILYIRGNQKAFIFATFFAGLSFQFETASAVALIPLVIGVGLLGLSKKSTLKIFLLSTLSFLLSLVTFILFDLRHHFLIFSSTFQLFNQQQGHKDYATLLERIIDHFLGMKSVYESVLFTSHPIMVLLAISICAYFFFISFKKIHISKTVKEFLFLFVTPAFVYLFYMLYPHPIYGEYVLDIIMSVIFAFCFVLVTLWKERVGKILVCLFLLGTLIFVLISIKNMYVGMYTQGNSSGSYIVQKEVTDWIWQDAGGKSFGYFVYTPETFTYGMDYLFWWESARYHTQLPESKKLANTYLILYPSLEHDAHAHAFWIQNTIHTKAHVLEQKVFQGGIVVEKMDMEKDVARVDQNYYQNLIFR